MKRFKEWGSLGGQKRALHLSPVQRSVIASRAAQTRWKKSMKGEIAVTQSVRLDSFSLDDPVYLQEILLDGTMADWQQLCVCLAERPFGAVAQTLEKVLLSEKIYGVTPLWRGILKNLQGTVEK